MIDLLPSQAERWQKVEALARNHFRRAGLGEIRTPLIEHTELFSRGIGETTDVVGKEMYSFIDRGDRSCTLRPEGTASVVRSVIQNGLLSQGPQRLWYMGPMFRYERPQAGRQRQFHQIGAEFFGLSSEISDAELISIAWDFLNDLGLQELTLEINSLGTTEDRKKYRKNLVAWLENFSEQLDDQSLKQLKQNPLRILDSKKAHIQELLNGAPMIGEVLCQESQDRFLNIQSILNSLGIPFTINQKLVRGLDYYCHTAFEITSKQLGAQATVCGGGRYDGLVEQLGGPATPSIGWAIGLERLLILLSEDYFKKEVPEVYIVNKGYKAQIEALKLARDLRKSNFLVDIDHSGSAFSKQFKRANRSNASWAVVIGDQELLQKEIRLKRLKGEIIEPGEHFVKISDLNQIIERLRS
jgi:histidyl-tRNA synthetase